jgi:hypothetical protein
MTTKCDPMRELPFVFEVEDPVRCDYNGHWQDHGLAVETPKGDIFCESHAHDMETAFVAYSMETTGHPQEEEADHA